LFYWEYLLILHHSSLKCFYLGNTVQIVTCIYTQPSGPLVDQTDCRFTCDAATLALLLAGYRYAFAAGWLYSQLMMSKF